MEDYDIQKRWEALPKGDRIGLLELAKAVKEDRLPRWVKIPKGSRGKFLLAWIKANEQGGKRYTSCQGDDWDKCEESGW